MFDRLFINVRCRKRHQTAPMLLERLEYLAHLEEEGRAPSTRQAIASHLLWAAALLDLSPGDKVGEARLEQLRRQWREAHRPTHGRGRANPQVEKYVIGNVRRWLGYVAMMEPEHNHEPFAGLLTDFIDSNRTDRGLAEATLSRYGRTLRPFLHWCRGRIGSRLSRLKANNLQDYLQEPHCSNWSRATTAAHVAAIRVFLRWLAHRGRCTPSLADSLRAPRLYRHERYPVGPTWSQVQELIKSVPAVDMPGRRTRAMLLLLAVHGFRSSEVRRLRIEDIDWQNEVIRPTRPKQRRTSVYPLSRDVGDAIIAYLKSRPRCRYREVFLTLRQPYRPLSGGALSSLIRKHQTSLGHTPRRYGAHGLRHACATHLLNHGVTLKVIGDHLGHAMPRATEVYAKVDLKALAEVGDVRLPSLLACEQELTRSATPIFEVGSIRALRLVGDFSLKGII